MMAVPVSLTAFAATLLLLSNAVTARQHAGMYHLPPLLEFSNGTAVTDLAALQERKAEARRLLSETMYGTFPATVPALVAAVHLNQSQLRGHTDMFVRLTFNTSNQATFDIELIVPDSCTSANKCPLFMTQANHRRWAIAGVARGYVSLVYPGADSIDSTDVFRLAYPNATWGLIARRAWLGSRALDYVITLPFINPKQVSVTGHSRNGKQSMIMAAWDERVTAVISSSSGAPAMSPYRLTSSFTLSESPYGTWPNAPGGVNCTCVRNKDPRPADPRCCWWLPSVVEYDGRENEMPIDSHALLLLIAPRHFASECAMNDPCDPNFAVEKAYMEGKKVYSFLNATDNIRIVWRSGQHHGFEDIQNYFDFFDMSFNRPGVGMEEFPEVLYHNFSLPAWLASHPRVPFPAQGSIEDQLTWALGRLPPLAWSPGGEYGLDAWAYIEQMMGQGSDISGTHEGVSYMAINFGQYMSANIYFRQDALNSDTPLPAVVWLHPFSYQRGYTEDYPRDGVRAYEKLARAGYVVVAYDQMGFGHHAADKRLFYARYGNQNASLLGRMVQDVMSAVDFLSAPFDGSHPDGLPVVDQYGRWYPKVDKTQIYVAGYSLGGVVAGYAAALDKRIAGAGVLSALKALRNTEDVWKHGGLEVLASEHGLQPQLGWHMDNPAALPLDYDVLLQGIAPRPTLVYNQLQDRTVHQPSLAELLNRAKSKCSGLKVVQGNATSKLDDDMLDALVGFLNASVNGVTSLSRNYEK